jgi:hypothetical protein
MIVRLHPDICKLTYRYGRHHHTADFSQWKSRRLIRRDDVALPEANPYRSRLVTRTKG